MYLSNTYKEEQMEYSFGKGGSLDSVDSNKGSFYPNKKDDLYQSQGDYEKLSYGKNNLHLIQIHTNSGDFKEKYTPHIPFALPKKPIKKKEEGKQITIIKKLPKPDIELGDLEFYTRNKFESRNSVVAAVPVNSPKEQVVVKLYRDPARAEREKQVLQYLAGTDFAKYLPKIIITGDDLIIQSREPNIPTKTEDRVKILAKLHAAKFAINLPEINAQNIEALIEGLAELTRGKQRETVQLYGDASAHVSESPLVLIHGDAKPQNWVGRCLIDWESASYGHAEKDLARLLIDQRLSEHDIADLLNVYQREINSLNGANFDPNKFSEFTARFYAARYMESLKKLVTNVKKPRPNRKKVEFLRSLVNI